MELVNQEENQESVLPRLPVFARLDRLDRLVRYLEERRPTREVQQQYECKRLSSALEEVHQKGTIIDRLAMLEKRVFQLSLDIDGVDTSRSSSFTTALACKFELGSDSTLTRATSQDEFDRITHNNYKQGPGDITHLISSTSDSTTTSQNDYHMIAHDKVKQCPSEISRSNSTIVICQDEAQKIINNKDEQGPSEICRENITGKKQQKDYHINGKRVKNVKVMHYRKWHGWFTLGC